jgi:hypothetical protein
MADARIDYRNLCIAQLSDDLAAAVDERNSYRLLAQVAVAEQARLTAQNDALRRRNQQLISELQTARWVA